MSQSDVPRMIGSRDMHELLKELLSDLEPCRVLDAGTGYGAAAGLLRDRGFDVHCCDVDPGLFALEGIPNDPVDLNGAMPYEDGRFDCVVCANVLHRLYDVQGALREFSRVLRSGGTLVITFNNYSNIEKRIRFLFTGSLTNRTNEERYVQTIDDPAANVRQALFYPQVHNALVRTGLEIERVRSTRPRLGLLLLTPLALLIRAITTVLPMRKRRTNCLSIMNSWALLPGGKHLAIIARKPG